MHGRWIGLFATREDLIELFEAADPGGRLKYVDQHYLWAEQRPRREWSSLRHVRGLGRSAKGRKSAGPWLLVVDRRAKVRERRHLVYGRRWKWSLDNNPRGATMFAPGVYKAGRAVMGGTISTLRSTPGAERIIRDLRNAMRRMKWPRTNLFWFGPRALVLARAGWRCTEDVTSPPNYDVPPPKT